MNSAIRVLPLGNLILETDWLNDIFSALNFKF